MGEKPSLKNGFKIILIILLLSTILLIATTPLHEAVHWIISDIDPYSEPVEFHIFDDKALNKHENILSSYLGYVVIKETYPGSFDDRPIWMDLFQEIICIFLQIFITVIIVVKILSVLAGNRSKCDS
jgi:hypothetical protein